MSLLIGVITPHKKGAQKIQQLVVGEDIEWVRGNCFGIGS